jgi:hypothetical protein
MVTPHVLQDDMAAVWTPNIHNWRRQVRSIEHICAGEAIRRANEDDVKG